MDPEPEHFRAGGTGLALAEFQWQWGPDVRQAGVLQGEFLPWRVAGGGNRGPLASLGPQILKLHSAP